VLRRRRDPLLGADDVGDLHQPIVDDVGEVIGRKAVRFEQHLVVDLRVVELDGAAQAIDEGGLALERHGQAHDEGLAAGRSTRALVGWDGPAVPVVPDVLLGLLLLGAELIDALLRAEAAIGLAARDEDLRVLLVNLGTLRLAVGPERAADVRPLVPREADPSEGAGDGLPALAGGGGAVGGLAAGEGGGAVFSGGAWIGEGGVGGGG